MKTLILILLTVSLFSCKNYEQERYEQKLKQQSEQDRKDLDRIKKIHNQLKKEVEENRK